MQASLRRRDHISRSSGFFTHLRTWPLLRPNISIVATEYNQRCRQVYKFPDLSFIDAILRLVEHHSSWSDTKSKMTRMRAAPGSNLISSNATPHHHVDDILTFSSLHLLRRHLHSSVFPSNPSRNIFKPKSSYTFTRNKNPRISAN